MNTSTHLFILCLTLAIIYCTDAQRQLETETDKNDFSQIDDLVQDSKIFLRPSITPIVMCSDNKTEERITKEYKKIAQCLPVCLDGTNDNTNRTIGEGDDAITCCCVVNEVADNEFTVGVPGKCDTVVSIEDTPVNGTISLFTRPSFQGGLRDESCTQVTIDNACKSCTQFWTIPREDFESEGGRKPRPTPSSATSSPTPSPLPSATRIPSMLPSPPPTSARAASSGDATCVEESYLRRRGFSERHFVHPNAVTAQVLCPLDSALPCATQHHMVRIDGRALSYAKMCQMIACERKVTRVNSVYSHVWAEETGDVVLTMFDVRYFESAQKLLHLAMRTWREL